MAARTTQDIIQQLEAAGVVDYIKEKDTSHTGAVYGRMRIEVLNKLDGDDRFASGILYQLHRDVGPHLTEFRAHPGELGPGSLQIVIDKRTGRFYADIDGFNPYSDVVNFIGHAFVDVMPHFIKKLFRRKGQDHG